jgi:uncharacterized protein (TIGR00255 family)
MRCRLPPGFESFEPSVRKCISERLKRGSVFAGLTLTWDGGQSNVRINQEVLDQILALLPSMKQQVMDSAPASLESLLGLRGVLETVDVTPRGDARTELETDLLQGLSEALAALLIARDQEGERLIEPLHGHLERIGALCAQADEIVASHPTIILDRLRDQVAELLNGTAAVPPDRLAQEVALLATKADTREEIDRLKAHVEAALALLKKGGPIGRQLDFLCQEFNREANTLCSKAATIDMTRTGIDLKTTIEQLREQVQNIE